MTINAARSMAVGPEGKLFFKRSGVNRREWVAMVFENYIPAAGKARIKSGVFPGSRFLLVGLECFWVA
jgi:hypothetical protein